MTGNLQQKSPFYSQLSPWGHPAITDTPVMRTTAKSQAKIIIIYKRLTEKNSRCYGLSLMRTLTRGPYSVHYKGRWLHFQKTPTHTHTVWATSEGQSQGISVSSSFRRKTGTIRPTSSAEGSISRLRKPGAGGGRGVITFPFLFSNFLIFTSPFWKNGKVKNKNEITLWPPWASAVYITKLKIIFTAFCYFVQI